MRCLSLGSRKVGITHNYISLQCNGAAILYRKQTFSGEIERERTKITWEGGEKIAR